MQPGEISARRAARLASVSDRTLRRWIERGDLPATQDDAGVYHVKLGDLDSLTRKRRRKPRGTAAGDESTPISGQLEALTTRMELIEARLAALESRGVSVEPLYRPLQGRPIPTPFMPIERPERPLVKPQGHYDVDATGWPISARGQAHYLASLPGCPLRWTSIKDWDECGTWVNLQDALATFRRRGYTNWSPVPLANPTSSGAGDPDSSE